MRCDAPQPAAGGDLLRAKFGDLVENGWASEENPTRKGFFVREAKRTGKLNAGRYWEITDGKGKFWELSPVGEHKITVTAAVAWEGVYVPREPTPEMIEAAHAVWRKQEDERYLRARSYGQISNPGWAEKYYQAMLSAAPPQPVPQQPVGADDDEPAGWAVAAERAAMEAYASYMGDPDGRDDTHSAQRAAAKAIEKHVLAALSSQPEERGGDVLLLLNEARDLLMERVHGSPARSPAHNARLVVEAAIATLTPASTGIGEKSNTSADRVNEAVKNEHEAGQEAEQPVAWRWVDPIYPGAWSWSASGLQCDTSKLTDFQPLYAHPANTVGREEVIESVSDAMPDYLDLTPKEHDDAVGAITDAILNLLNQKEGK
jgi:hypothetical protein